MRIQSVNLRLSLRLRFCHDELVFRFLEILANPGNVSNAEFLRTVFEIKVETTDEMKNKQNVLSDEM